MINIDHNSDKYHCLKAIKLLVVVTTQLQHQFTYFHFFFLIKKCSCNNLIVVGSAFCDNYDDQFFLVCLFCFVFVGLIFFGSNTQQNHRVVDIIGYAFWCGSYPRNTWNTNTKDDLGKKKGHLKFVGIGHNCVAPFLSLVYPVAFPSLFHYMGQVCLFLNLVSCGLCVCDDHGFHWLVSAVGNVVQLSITSTMLLCCFNPVR